MDISERIGRMVLLDEWYKTTHCFAYSVLFRCTALYSDKLSNFKYNFN